MKNGLVLVCLLLWSSLVGAEPMLSAPEMRMTDAVIQDDLKLFHALEKRLELLDADSIMHGRYHVAKTRALLKMAWDEYHENERTELVEAALKEAKSMLEAMEAKQQDISLDTDMLPDTQKVRPKLWLLAQEMKQSNTFHCVEEPIAELEIELQWAGHEVGELGLIHARNELDDAENLAKRAQTLWDACDPVQEEPACIPASRLCEQPLAPMFPVAEPVVVTPPEHRTIVYFDLDQGNLNAKGPGTLDAALQFIQQYPDAYRIRIEAHTDRLASEAHNMPLSKRRAEHVRDYFIEHGLAANLFEIAWFGETKPEIFCSDELYPTHDDLAACLQPNRRAEVIIYTPKGE